MPGHPGTAVREVVVLIVILAASGSGVNTLGAFAAAGAGASGGHVNAPSGVSTALLSIFFGDGVSANGAKVAADNSTRRAALRAQLNSLLDSVEPHYSRLLLRTHELYEPGVASLLQDLLLLPRGSATRKLGEQGDEEEVDTARSGYQRHNRLLQPRQDAEDHTQGTARATNEARRRDHQRRRHHQRSLTDLLKDGSSAASNGGSGPGPGDYHHVSEDPPLAVRAAKAAQPFTVPQQLPSRLSATASPPSLAQWAQRVGERLAQLPSYLSYPVLRRLLAAVIVRAWLDGGCEALAEKDEAAVRALFVQLFSLHRLGAQQRGVMDYQHVSKSGGTSWCHAARLNGCTTQRFDKFYVCGINSFEDRVRWIDAAAHRRLTGGEPTRWALHGTRRSETAPDCAGRAEQMHAHGWTYYSNEYTLTGGETSLSGVELCSRQFVTAILVRHPLMRMTSHLRFVLLHYNHFMAAQGPAGGDFFKTYANANASFWLSVAPAITDNYYTRTLLGEATWHAPVGSISTLHHVAAARLVLLQYDVVIPLEAAVPVSSRLLSFGAGWLASYTDVHDKNITELQENFNFDPTPYMPSTSDMDRLARQQTADMELYQLTVLIGQLDYLVYGTAAAAGVIPWQGMPQSWTAEDPSANRNLGCGLLRGPEGAWAGGLSKRWKRRRSGHGEGQQVVITSGVHGAPR